MHTQAPATTPTAAPAAAAAAASAADHEQCWICLDDASEDGSLRLVQPCACPRRVHPQCLARWQLQQAGRHEEKHCRFCNSALADWKGHLTPKELAPEVPNVQPIMVVYFEGQIHRIPVKQGPDGLAEFQSKIRDLFRLPDDVDISLTFGCKEPMSGQHLKLEGVGAFDAAVHCASVAAADRQQKLRRSQSAGDVPAAAAAGGAGAGAGAGGAAAAGRGGGGLGAAAAGAAGMARSTSSHVLRGLAGSSSPPPRAAPAPSAAPRPFSGRSRSFNFGRSNSPSPPPAAAASPFAAPGQQAGSGGGAGAARSPPPAAPTTPPQLPSFRSIFAAVAGGGGGSSGASAATSGDANGGSPPRRGAAAERLLLQAASPPPLLAVPRSARGPSLPPRGAASARALNASAASPSSSPPQPAPRAAAAAAAARGPSLPLRGAGAGAGAAAGQIAKHERLSSRQITHLTDVPEADETVAVGSVSRDVSADGSSLGGRLKFTLRAFSRKVARSLSFTQQRGGPGAAARSAAAAAAEAPEAPEAGLATTTAGSLPA